MEALTKRRKRDADAEDRFRKSLRAICLDRYDAMRADGDLCVGVPPSNSALSGNADLPSFVSARQFLAVLNGLDELRVLADASRELKTLLGTDYLIKPDVVVIKDALDDAVINRNAILVDKPVARKTALRASNAAKASLHASVSCKLTIRSDRVQNTRSEALNLLRNRKGRAPHIVAVIAEPTPSRIAAIALGTGDIDCRYHFALPELVEVLKEQGGESLELVETMIDGKRLQDIADLPLDLVI